MARKSRLKRRMATSSSAGGRRQSDHAGMPRRPPMRSLPRAGGIPSAAFRFGSCWTTDAERDPRPRCVDDHRLAVRRRANRRRTLGDAPRCCGRGCRPFPLAVGGRQCAAQRGAARALQRGDRSLARLARLPISRDGETDDHASGQTRTLARKEDLSLYDAACLERAIRRRMPLSSCDQALVAAAERRKVRVFRA